VISHPTPETGPAASEPSVEELLLCEAVVFPERFPQVLHIARPEHFQEQLPRLAWETLARLRACGVAADFSMLALEVARVHSQPPAMVRAALMRAAVAVSSPAFMVSRARYIRSRASIARLGDSCAQVALESKSTPAGDAEAFARKALSKIVDDTIQAGGQDRRLEQVSTSMQELTSGEGVLPAVPSGLLDLDRITGGLWPCELSILGARPSKGKTALAVSLAINVAKKGNRTLFFSLEMDRRAVEMRVVSNMTGCNLQRLRTGQLLEDERRSIEQSHEQITSMPLLINFCPAATVQEVEELALQSLSQDTPKLIVVDYLQLMTWPRSESRTQEVSAITRALKVMAQRLECPVVALAQLNRQVEQRDNKRPRLADLRESGSIEQDADIVMLMHREDRRDRDDADPTLAEIAIAKNRNGPTGVFRLHFDETCAAFRNRL
jgi:replicative DNA helicase